MARANCRFCGHYQEIIDDVVMGECLRCRDQFALAALNGLMCGMYMSDANDGEGFIGDPHIGEAARDAYRYADAMMEARKTPGPSMPSETPKESNP